MSQWRIATKQWTKFFFSMITRLLPLNMVRALFESSMEALHHRGPDFITHRTLSKSGEKGPYHVLDPILPMPHEPIGLVLQGPLLLQDDFTVESVRYYSRVKPQVIVIVSTWEGEDAGALERIKALGAEIVLNKKPTCSGRSNVNYQVVSTRGGIERAIQLGCQHVAKTRTDQRVYSLPTLLSLPQLSVDYPVMNAPMQKYRLISVSRGNAKFGPNFLSDFFMFGNVFDMKKYWDPPIDTVDYHHLCHTRGKAFSLSELISRSAENYLLSNYLMSVGEIPDTSLKVWWELLADRFCSIDWSAMDIYWPKYEKNAERTDLAGDANIILHFIKFIDWINLYNRRMKDEIGIVPDYILLSYLNEKQLPSRMRSNR